MPEAVPRCLLEFAVFCEGQLIHFDAYAFGRRTFVYCSVVAEGANNAAKIVD